MRPPELEAARGRGAAGGPVHGRFLVSPAGALLAGVCFFLPWGRLSCAGIEREVSGAAVGGWLWLAFAAAAVALIAPFAGRWLARPQTARAVAFGAALFGLLVLGWRAVEFSRGFRTPLGTVRPDRIGFEPAPGFVGTVIGLLVASAGAWLPPPKPLGGTRAPTRAGGTDRPGSSGQAMPR